MEAKRFWVLFGIMLFISAIGELLLLFAAAYIAITVYKTMTFTLTYFIALCVVGGVFAKFVSEVIKRKALNI